MSSPNPQFDPASLGGGPELVLNVLKTDPLPAVAPNRIVNRAPPDRNFTRQDAHRHLNKLVDAGWVHARGQGLYDLAADPRDNIPGWPVDQNDVDTLPEPHPNPPDNPDGFDGDYVRTMHAWYTGTAGNPPTVAADRLYKSDADPELVLNILKTDPLPVTRGERVVARATSDDYDRQPAHDALRLLVDMGWVQRRARGLYDLVHDPRDDAPDWPVAWDDAEALPGTLPEPPADPEAVAALQERYRPTQS